MYSSSNFPNYLPAKQKFQLEYLPSEWSPCIIQLRMEISDTKFNIETHGSEFWNLDSMFVTTSILIADFKWELYKYSSWQDRRIITYFKYCWYIYIYIFFITTTGSRHFVSQVLNTDSAIQIFLLEKLAFEISIVHRQQHSLSTRPMLYHLSYRDQPFCFGSKMYIVYKSI